MAFREDEERAFRIVHEQEIVWATLGDREELGRQRNREINREVQGKFAAKVGLDPEELIQAMADDVAAFKRTSKVAVEGHVTYRQAQKLLGYKVLEGQDLQDRISNYQNSRGPRASYPKEPKPKIKIGNKSIYENHYRTKSSAGWRERSAKLAAFYFRQNAVNTKAVSSPSDLEENPFDAETSE